MMSITADLTSVTSLGNVLLKFELFEVSRLVDEVFARAIAHRPEGG